MTLRSRLTLLISGVLMLTLLGFSAALYLALARTTLVMTEESLAREAVRLLGDKEFALGRIVDPPESVGLPATYVQTLNAAGAPLTRSANLMGSTMPLSAAGLHALRGGASCLRALLPGCPGPRGDRCRPRARHRPSHR